jgi:hypothetical protein
MRIKGDHVFRAFYLSSYFAFLFFMAALGSASATTYYVAPSGLDSNAGSASSPFQTIQHAADIVYPGDTVIVKAGTYTDTNSRGTILHVSRSGTATSWITFKSENLYGAVLDGQNNATAIGIDIFGASYITIEGFEIKGFNWGGVNANVNGSNIPNYVSIKRNKIHDIGVRPFTGTYGLVAIFTPKQSHHYTIDGNLIYNVGRTSTTYNWLDQVIYLCGYDHIVTNNIFYNPSGWKGACVSIDAEYDPGDGKNITIANNTFCDPQVARPGQITINWMFDGQISNVIIANNIFYNPDRAAVWPYSSSVQGMTSVSIRNNLTTAPKLVTDALSDDTNWNGTGINASNNLVNTDPKFVGAATRNYRLSADSPAVSLGNVTDAPNHDFDQLSRPQGTGVDASAYEFQENSALPGPSIQAAILLLLN